MQNQYSTVARQPANPGNTQEVSAETQDWQASKGYTVEGDPIFYRLAELNLNPLDIKKKFLDKIDRSAGPDGCWIYTGPKASRGYGQASFVRPIRHIRTHRLAMMLQVGPLPDDKVVMHSCDNPPCCNPAHLSLGSHADNTRDAINKGRIQLKSRFLKLADVERVRHLIATTDLKQREIADRFGISASVISSIKKGTYGAREKPLFRPYKPTMMDVSEVVAFHLATEYGRHYNPHYVDHVRNGRMKSPKLLELIGAVMVELGQSRDPDIIAVLAKATA